MKVELPSDPDRAWRSTLTPWQRTHLADAARGTYGWWHGHGRLAVVIVEGGFDIVGMKKMAVVDSHGTPIPDAWTVAWVDEVHADRTSCDSVSARQRYGAPPISRHHRRLQPDYKIAYDGRSWRRKLARDRRRIKRYNKRCVKLMAEWIGSPLTYPGPFPKELR